MILYLQSSVTVTETLMLIFRISMSLTCLYLCLSKLKPATHNPSLSANIVGRHWWPTMSGRVSQVPTLSADNDNVTVLQSTSKINSIV